jgi:hypothetical protein
MLESLIGLPHFVHGKTPISATLNNGSGRVEGMMLPCVGRERAALSVTGRSHGSGGDVNKSYMPGTRRSGQYCSLLEIVRCGGAYFGCDGSVGSPRALFPRLPRNRTYSGHRETIANGPKGFGAQSAGGKRDSADRAAGRKPSRCCPADPTCADSGRRGERKELGDAGMRTTPPMSAALKT